MFRLMLLLAAFLPLFPGQSKYRCPVGHWCGPGGKG